jgi:hypothetical protein
MTYKKAIGVVEMSQAASLRRLVAADIVKEPDR